ncbi:hypothetical protein LTR70_010755 [Exophiala xenobiotica]|uniref:DUF7924 domain-containing protein n=1 Tax=Lithohypha guttulata TaxID=1690604 RepID=A0ABR0JUI4_9EURO|nr:hypothetical protein LTR24_010738 [Lithohypha guttulata]KAK5308889.1 hypothetical protein LTR70_010755 [Exophiala xenobiotica]
MTLKRSYSSSDLAATLSNFSNRKRVKCGAATKERSRSCETFVAPKTVAPGPVLRSAHEGPRSTQRNVRKRDIQSVDSEAPKKKRKKHNTQLSQSAPASITDWVSSLPNSHHEFETMAKAPSTKRPRSASDASEVSLPSDTEVESTLSRETKNSIYKNPRYPTVMASKGSFMHESSNGPLPEERDLCKRLLVETTPPPDDPVFEPQRVLRLRTLLQDRSELRVCIDLHPRLVPSAEVLALQHPHEFENLVEGHNDRWLDAVVFFRKLPQPDRTVAYPLSAFTEAERRKLGLVPECASLFTTRDGMMFPFFTCEVKCGKEALAIADRANTNSMTIALRAVVELHRQAGDVMGVHRKILGFSISHDDGIVRIYGHYPEIEGENTTYFRTSIREFSYADKNAQDRWTSYTFVRNLYTQFAPDHLQRIKEAIGRLSDPLALSVDTITASNLPSASEPDTAPLTPVTSNSDAVFVKPGPRQRLTNATMMQQLEQQRKDFMAQLEQQQRESKQQAEQQQKEAKEREAKLMAQLEQQQKEAKEQHAELMKLLKHRMMPDENSEDK